MMNTKINQDECISSLVDGELTDAQLDTMLSLMKSGHDNYAQNQWNVYHQIGDALRSDELDCAMSNDFTEKLSRLLEQEPLLLSPVKTDVNQTLALKSYLPRYVAMTSIAAAVMVAFIMTPQILPLITHGSAASSEFVTKNESSALKNDTNVQLAKNHENGEKVDEFAPALMDQVEMLRDPTLDSYLMAHQKASPAFAHSGRYVKKANIDPTKEAEK